MHQFTRSSFLPILHYQHCHIVTEAYGCWGQCRPGHRPTGRRARRRSPHPRCPAPQYLSISWRKSRHHRPRGYQRRMCLHACVLADDVPGTCKYSAGDKIPTPLQPTVSSKVERIPSGQMGSPSSPHCAHMPVPASTTWPYGQSSTQVPSPLSSRPSSQPARMCSCGFSVRGCRAPWTSELVQC